MARVRSLEHTGGDHHDRAILTRQCLGFQILLIQRRRQPEGDGLVSTERQHVRRIVDAVNIDLLGEVIEQQTPRSAISSIPPTIAQNVCPVIKLPARMPTLWRKHNPPNRRENALIVGDAGDRSRRSCQPHNRRIGPQPIGAQL
jgi:hypothetical protein